MSEIVLRDGSDDWGQVTLTEPLQFGHLRRVYYNRKRDCDTWVMDVSDYRRGHIMSVFYHIGRECRVPGPLRAMMIAVAKEALGE